jgi:hypothetical protein
MCIRTAWCYSRIARLPQDFDKFVLICESWEKHVSHSRIVDVSFLLEIVVSPKISTSSINFTKPTSLLISGCCLSHLSEELTRISRHAKGKEYVTKTTRAHGPFARNKRAGFPTERKRPRVSAQSGVSMGAWWTHRLFNSSQFIIIKKNS